MSSEKPEIIKKYQKIAEKYVANRLIRPDEKRHDRISSSEAQAIKMAYKEGLSGLKIAELFKRDPRSVGKILPIGKKGLLALTILKAGRRVLDFKTGKYARLIKFRIGNHQSNMILVEKIRLEVLDCVFRSKSAGVPEQTGHPSGANRPPFRSKPATPGVR